MKLVANIIFRRSLLPLSFIQGTDMSKAGGDFLPWVFRVDYNVHESFATFGEIRDLEGGRGKRERERGKT